MATATLTYNLDEMGDRSQFACAAHSMDMWIAMEEFANYLRSQTKYGEDEARVAILEEVKAKFYECMNDREVSLDMSC